MKLIDVIGNGQKGTLGQYIFFSPVRKEMIRMIGATEEMTNFTFKMDRKTRESYSALCEAFGLSMSAATLALVRQAVRSQSMTFSMRDANGFTPAEAAELKRRIDDVTAGNVTAHSIIEA